jgi:tetraacyldisaccharide 4'-kinase
MPESASERLRAAWLGRGWLACALLPLAWLYGALAGLRRQLYRVGFFRAWRAPVPVIVVGNVIAGGAGKTPTAVALVLHLQALGWQVGVVTRGYGRSAADCREVQHASAPQDVGDEPLLILQRTSAPVFVARSRPEAARALLVAYPRTDVIVCDDGLQHLALARDLEVVVFDERGTGNGWLLPAGPLRESWPRATGVPALVLQTGPVAAFAGFTARRSLASQALRRDGRTVSLTSLAGRPVHALAGIARPEVFFAMLRDAGLPLASTQALPDHYDFDSWKRPAGVDSALVCTEKDARKLWPHAPDALAVPLELHVEPAFFKAVDAALDQLPSSVKPQ